MGFSQDATSRPAGVRVLFRILDVGAPFSWENPTFAEKISGCVQLQLELLDFWEVLSAAQVWLNAQVLRNDAN